jgi:16S rRNA (uracil1498-N3)-methyltransferase
VNLFYQPLISEGYNFLEEEESRHCIKVLRKTTGEPLRITDGKGSFYDTIISKADSRKCGFEIKHREYHPKKNFSIHIAISPTKNTDRIEWFVEKAVEIGIDTITLIDCKNTERAFVKKDRLEKLVISAMKQSLKPWLPEINALQKFDAFITIENAEEKFIAYVDQSNPNHLKDLATVNKSYVVLIGPEGDFSPDELSSALENHFKKISLGSSRLRTETAGIAACHILNLINS